MKQHLLAIAIAITVAGCAATGTKFDIAQADTFQPGVTTLSEAQSSLGKPMSVSTAADGTQVLRWQFVSVTPVQNTGARLDIVFDKDGKMVRVARRTTVGAK